MPEEFGPSVVAEKVLPKPYNDDDDYDDEDDYEDHDYLSTYLAYKKITSKTLQLTLDRGVRRVKFFQSYFSKEPALVPVLGELEGYFIEVQDFMSNLGTKNNFAHKAMLVDLTKKTLQTWEGIENMLLQLKLKPVPADYPRQESVPSAWLFEREWRDEAYEEIILLRKKYSHLLDHAYLHKCASSMKTRRVGGLLPLSYKKLLKFVASSREDIELMSIRKCYNQVMRIKAICIPIKQEPLDTQKMIDQVQLPNWRDEIYEQVTLLGALLFVWLFSCFIIPYMYIVSWFVTADTMTLLVGCALSSFLAKFVCLLDGCTL